MRRFSLQRTEDHVEHRFLFRLILVKDGKAAPHGKVFMEIVGIAP
jgi:hypothetical protein